ncbi:MAG TPA: hypothetical protein VIL37_12555 [Natronosporangium sp.]
MSEQSPASPEQSTSKDAASEPAEPTASAATETATTEPSQASEPAKPVDAAQSSAAEPQPAAEELPAQPVAAAPPPPPVPEAPPKQRRVWPAVVITLIAALAVVGIGGYFVLRALAEDLPQVGDCLTNAADANDMEVIACDSPDAAWSVIGSDGDWTRGEFDSAGQGEVCASFPETQQALWVTSAAQVQSDTVGELLCLAPLDPAGAGQ